MHSEHTLTGRARPTSRSSTTITFLNVRAFAFELDRDVFLFVATRPPPVRAQTTQMRSAGSLPVAIAQLRHRKPFRQSELR